MLDGMRFFSSQLEHRFDGCTFPVFWCFFYFFFSTAMPSRAVLPFAGVACGRHQRCTLPTIANNPHAHTHKTRKKHDFCYNFLLFILACFRCTHSLSYSLLWVFMFMVPHAGFGGIIVIRSGAVFMAYACAYSGYRVPPNSKNKRRHKCQRTLCVWLRCASNNTKQANEKENGILHIRIGSIIIVSKEKWASSRIGRCELPWRVWAK